MEINIRTCLRSGSYGCEMEGCWIFGLIGVILFILFEIFGFALLSGFGVVLLRSFSDFLFGIYRLVFFC